ncbi:phosphotransferase family enzyme [Paenibacillus pabuli]|uniref:Phosphotransferase family enzyme n=1 Tax=Paenibacillus pabuli TaxID=1472 RepID=A0ABX9BGG7_9BACL|nr:phosphotransferase [Paenibacillus pabuli]RAI91760.1 phosphotransferase family enzyme [Paenibacillus pabuli]
MINIDFMAEHYDIGNILECHTIRQGNSSKAMLVRASYGNFVLRRLRNEQQAWAEYEMYQALASANITPSMVHAKDGLPFITDNHEVFNLQTYIENVLPHNQINVDFIRLGRLISHFHRLTIHLEIPEQADRFALPRLWREVSREITTSSSECIRSLQEHTEHCMEYKEPYKAIIHGDLGIWNLLFTKESLHIIDVGEVRKGDIHFDMAAALTSSIPTSVKEREVGEIVANFEQGYTEEGNSFRRKSLYEQMHMWVIRGLLAIIREKGMVRQTIPYVQRNLELLEKFRHVLCRD